MLLIDKLVLVCGILLVSGVLVTKLSARIGMPVLVLFLLVGMVAGSEGVGGIEFEDYRLTHAIGTLALIMILFDGGLGTSLAAIRLSWKPSVLLATLGVLVTAVITGLAASWILNISMMEGLLLGSIVSSTDASAVFAVLRWGRVGLPNRIASVLEVESASNDPMAIFLTISCIEILLGNVSIGPKLLEFFGTQMLIGGVVGLTGGRAAVWVLNHVELDATGMYPVLASAFALLIYGGVAYLGGSGFLAVYLAGVVIGNHAVIFQQGIRKFHDAIAWLAQIMMFVTLGLLAFPSLLLEVSGRAVLIAIVLMFVSRPIAVLTSLLPFRFTGRELAFMSWVGLKGAVPIILAILPLMLATEEHSLQAFLVFDVVFFAVVISAVIQGTSLKSAARWLGLECLRPPEPPVTLEISSLRQLDGQVVDYFVKDDSRAAGLQVRELALPGGVVIALIARGEKVIPPQGITRIHPGDHVILVLRRGTQGMVERVFGPASDEPTQMPNEVEFPFRGSITVGELEEFYSIRMDAAPETTLDELMRRRLGPDQVSLDAVVDFGPLRFRIQRLAKSGTIELIGMSIKSELKSGDAPDEG